MTDQTVRTPYCTKIRYGITGAPTLDESEMDGSHAPGVGVLPTSIELVYSAARDGKPASVSASVAGDWMRFGKPDGGQVTTHFSGGPDGWPFWLAEEARLHDPGAAVPSAVPAPAADRATEEHRLVLSDALGLGTGAPWDAIHDWVTELALPPLGQDPVARRLGLVAEHRATVLNEAADHLASQAANASPSARDVILADVAELRRLAVEARDGQTTQTEAQRSDVGTEFVQQIDNPDEAALNLWEADLAQSGVDTPGCDCGHDGMGVRWHDTACAWKVGLVAEVRQLLAKPDEPAGPAGGAQQPKEA